MIPVLMVFFILTISAAYFPRLTQSVLGIIMENIHGIKHDKDATLFKDMAVYLGKFSGDR